MQDLFYRPLEFTDVHGLMHLGPVAKFRCMAWLGAAWAGAGGRSVSSAGRWILWAKSWNKYRVLAASAMRKINLNFSTTYAVDCGA